MIVLITGASHTGKTLLAQKLLEKYQYPYLSIDHLKMGLIRSGQTDLTPYDDDKLTDYLWEIIKEMIKTAIKNEQNMIVEVCYIPFNYISCHFDDIIKNENVIENRMHDADFTIESIKEANQYNLQQCRMFGLDYVLIDGEYDIDQYCKF